MANSTEVISWLCFFLLGFGGWNVLNSLFLEAPYMVKRLPEGASLSTYLLIAQQIASLIVIVPTTLIGSSRASRYYPQIIIVTFVVSCLACIVLMIWSEDSVGKFSLPFLLMALVTSTLGYISTTYYFPFVSLYRVRYTNAYTLGLGFSLAFTAAISLIQDSGGDHPRFGFVAFFGIILASQIVAFIGAMWILYSGGSKTQLVSYVSTETVRDPDSDLEPCVHQVAAQNGKSLAQQQLEYDKKYPPPSTPGMIYAFSSWCILLKYWYPPVWQFALAFLGFGIVPSLLPFAAGSYYKGNSIYMWSLALLYLVDPFARLLYSFRVAEFARFRHINLMTIVCLCAGFLICLLAGMSPHHTWAQRDKNGGAIPITLAIVCGFTYAAAFTGSYTAMFNIGTDASEDDLRELEVEKGAPASPTESGEDQSKSSSSKASGEDTTHTTIQMTPKDVDGEQAVVDTVVEKPPAMARTGHCAMCTRDSERRDELRQIIYRLSGFALQFGSCVGTFVGAGLTVFSKTIPAPQIPVF